MLDIKIKGQSLDLYPDTILTFEQQNPLFQREIGAEGYSYPVDIPVSPFNVQLLGFLSNIQSATPFKDYECEVIVNNKSKMGTFSILKASPSRLTCSIFLGLFDKNTLSKSLNEIDLGGTRNVGDIPTHADSLINTTVETADYAFFPLLNRHFYTENATQEHYAGIVNAFNPLTGQFTRFTLENDTTDPQEPQAYISQTTCFTPFPYLVYVLKRVANAFNKQLSGSFIQHPDIKQLTIYNNYALDEFREDTASGLSGNLHATSINLKNHVPNMTIREFLNALIIKFNVAITIKGNELNISFKKEALNGLSDDDYSDTIESNIIIEPFLTQDTEGVTFTDAVDSNDTAQKEFSNIIVRNEAINEAVNHQQQFTIPTTEGHIQFHIDLHEYFKANKTGGNNYFGDYDLYIGAAVAPKFKVGKGGEEIESKISNILMVKNTIDYPVAEMPTGWLLPNADQKGNSKVSYYELGTDNPCSLRLLFYKGLQQVDDNLQQQYPLGTSDIYSANSINTGPVGTLSLQWGGANGTYAQLYQKWLDKLQKAKAANIILALQPEQWAKLDLLKPKYCINQNILIEKLTVSVTMKGMRKATARIIKL